MGHQPWAQLRGHHQNGGLREAYTMVTAGTCIQQQQQLLPVCGQPGLPAAIAGVSASDKTFCHLAPPPLPRGPTFPLLSLYLPMCFARGLTIWHGQDPQDPSFPCIYTTYHLGPGCPISGWHGAADPMGHKLQVTHHMGDPPWCPPHWMSSLAPLCCVVSTTNPAPFFCAGCTSGKAFFFCRACSLSRQSPLLMYRYP